MFSPKPTEHSESAMSDTSPSSSDEDASAQAQDPLGLGRQVHVTLTLPQFIRIAIVNILVLVELCVAMYMAEKNPDEFTPVFFKVFFSLLVPTLILAAVSKRFVRPKEQS